MSERLIPSMDSLRSTVVLMQASKKTMAFIRNHNWYTDVLELDIARLDFPEMIKRIQSRLCNVGNFKTKPIFRIDAPKSQKWKLLKRAGRFHWQSKIKESKLRSLAHIDLEDQIIATAMMLCMANHVENKLGNPKTPMKMIVGNAQDIGRRTTDLRAYGNRLYCHTRKDKNGEKKMECAWGATITYRNYFADYQNFLARPSACIAELNGHHESETCFTLVHMDIMSFYDKISRELLRSSVQNIFKGAKTELESDFLILFEHLFSWEWAVQSKEISYPEVVLPQGLVASGFFANIVLYQFLHELQFQVDAEIKKPFAFKVCDVCSYVDDLRFVIESQEAISKDQEKEFTKWVQKYLDKYASGLCLNDEKTVFINIEPVEKVDENPKIEIKQSEYIQHIQHAVSGGFDVVDGLELIDSIENFFHIQQLYSSSVDKNENSLLDGISDVKESTAYRFASARYRRTYRSLRPLLDSKAELGFTDDATFHQDGETDNSTSFQLTLSQEQLDKKAYIFAASWIDIWVKDPVNVKVMRIALDMCPSPVLLKYVLNVLSGIHQKGRRGRSWEKRARKYRVYEYCLSQLFMAGATETGIVDDNECLPCQSKIDKYRKILIDEANKILTTPSYTKKYPWFLIQQVLLYMLVHCPNAHNKIDCSNLKDLSYKRYKNIINYQKEPRGKTHEDAQYLIIIYSGLHDESIFERLKISRCEPVFLQELASISPYVTKKWWECISNKINKDTAWYEYAQCLDLVSDGIKNTHDQIVTEYDCSMVASQLTQLSESEFDVLETPKDVYIKLNEKNNGCSYPYPRSNNKGYFAVPEWDMSLDEKRAYKLGLIILYYLRPRIDFVRAYREEKKVQKKYTVPEAHLQLILCSINTMRQALGEIWCPISTDFQKELFVLLAAPGYCGDQQLPWNKLQEKFQNIWEKIEKNKSEDVLLLHEQVPFFNGSRDSSKSRCLRVGLVQSVIPTSEQYHNVSCVKLENNPEVRLAQRKHLIIMLGAIRKLLALRASHEFCEQGTSHSIDRRPVDLLIFPELAIHPDDVNQYLIPFVRKYKCIIQCGLTYHERRVNESSIVINSSLWIIPCYNSSRGGLEIRLIEQGKKHLSKDERRLCLHLKGFRPVQWIINYIWTDSDSEPVCRKNTRKHIKLTSSICYDATDVALSSILAKKSDLYIVNAMNKDVNTFDIMQESLHYHMYQPFVVVNNGQYGGSGFYSPFHKEHNRKVGHLHGMRQASVLFAEISPCKLIHRGQQCNSESCAYNFPIGDWKEPPAGWVNF